MTLARTALSSMMAIRMTFSTTMGRKQGGLREFQFALASAGQSAFYFAAAARARSAFANPFSANIAGKGAALFSKVPPHVESCPISRSMLQSER
jgi:hypothetical protein